MQPLLATTLLVLLAGCAVTPEWQRDMQSALSTSRRGAKDLVVYFALPGHDSSDFMESRLPAPVVLQALMAGDFVAVIADGIERKRMYAEWIGGNEGMGMCVLDGQGYCYAARPGPQDPEQVAAFLTLCVSKRAELAELRGKLQQEEVGPTDLHALGCLLLELGCRVHAEPLLTSAAVDGVAESRLRLAQLFALDGNLTAAKRWLKTAPKTPAAKFVGGYVLFKERRYAAAVKALQAAVDTKKLGADRQNALLYLGKSLHQDKRDEQAIPILEALAAEATGSIFEAAASHTLGHIYNPDHGHILMAERASR
ncbi:MAG: tetratricopeptide (TPR) repeat protein [Hyphomicrobiaceae bacterium]|jgi:tetratricopeptide (TPR) repeat protein